MTQECKKCGRVFGSVKCFDVDCPNNTPKIAMNQQHKELLIKDLCGRLPYKVKCEIKGETGVYTLNRIEIDYENGHLFDFSEQKNGLDMQVYSSEVKPYLFPLSSMTSELWIKEFSGFGITRDFFEYGCETLEFNDCNPDLLNMIGFINQLIKNHFDIYGLIPMGLANDATGLNIY